MGPNSPRTNSGALGQHHEDRACNTDGVAWQNGHELIPTDEGTTNSRAVCAAQVLDRKAKAPRAFVDVKPSVLARDRGILEVDLTSGRATDEKWPRTGQRLSAEEVL